MGSENVSISAAGICGFGSGMEPSPNQVAATSEAREPDAREPDVALLGGKGASLVTMAHLGLPVPPGFILPTTFGAVCRSDGWTPELNAAVTEWLEKLERATGRTLGSGPNPLLVSVRSGAAVSMPGMMDSVLNVGMNLDVARCLAEVSSDAAFAADTYRRAVLGYAEIVLGLSSAVTAEIAAREDVDGVTNLDALAVTLSDALSEHNCVVPNDAAGQVRGAIEAVFASWSSPRAEKYREIAGIDEAGGTAATVQTMVFGNLGTNSATGVAFTRDPVTGTGGLTGDFLPTAQGEDVVAGTHQARPLTDMEQDWPQPWAQLQTMANTLEAHFADMMDIEFTIEQGVLHMLQARRAKRTPAATFRSAVAMALDPDFPVDQAEAVRRCAHLMDEPPTEVLTDAASAPSPIATGLAASPGSVSGLLCIDIDDAVERSARGEQVILVRRETSPADIHGMAAAVGLLTTLGGMVSHAAVVARDWALPAVVGVKDLEITDAGISAGDVQVQVGELVSIDGTSGSVFLGRVVTAETPIAEVATIQSWARSVDTASPSGVESTPLDNSGSDGTVAITEEDCLRTLALKGMAQAGAVAAVLSGASGAEATVADHLSTLVERELVIAAGERFRPSDAGRELVDQVYGAEREGRVESFNSILDEFHQPNMRFKEIMVAWQIRSVDGEDVPNDHTDAVYDGQVLDRVQAEIHALAEPLVTQCAALLPRLARYSTRLAGALELARTDSRFMAHPLLDSYHTIWFELHEELIKLAGRDRLSETKAGRA